VPPFRAIQPAGREISTSPFRFAKKLQSDDRRQRLLLYVNYRAYEAGTKVETFKPAFLKEYGDLLTETGKLLLAPQDYFTGPYLIIEQEHPAREKQRC